MDRLLETITERTRTDLSGRKRRVPESQLKDSKLYHRPRRDFRAALTGELSESGLPEGGGMDPVASSGSPATGGESPVAVIAEIKKASPSKGVIRSDFEPAFHARQYRDGGAAALSVLTDEPFFQGSLDDMQAVAQEVDLPVLRKDFIMDFYQLHEARARGADAVLLIATILAASQLQELHHAAREAGLQCLVECYGARDMEKLDFDQVELFGVNNRNLNTFQVDVHRGVELLRQAPGGVVRVSESGISNSEDLRYLYRYGIHAALIGESLMREEDPGRALLALRNINTP